MQRVDGAYLYNLGRTLQRITLLRDASQTNPSSNIDLFVAAFVSVDVLSGFLDQSIFRPRYCRAAGHELLKALVDVREKNLQPDADLNNQADEYQIRQLQQKLSEFETLFSSEFGQLPLYMVSKKGAYDTSDLIEDGAALFPSILRSKAPDAVKDVALAARCLAFELFTAAGFHIHRANESVLHKYFSSVAPNVEKPKSGNIGEYLKLLEEKKLGNSNVRSALKDLKNLHRNPLIHPDHSLEDVDEAMALISAVHAVVGYMLREIPEPVIGAANLSG